MNESELLKSLKNNYDNIEIPDDLLSKVNEALEIAKDANKKEVSTSSDEDARIINIDTAKSLRKRHKRRNIFIGVAAAFALFFILPNTSENVAHAMESVPILGEIVKVITIREYKDDRGNVSADIKTPEITNESYGNAADTGSDASNSANLNSDAVNGSSKNNAKVDEVNNEIKKYTDEIIKQYESDANIQGSDGHENVTTDYDVVTDNDKLFALRFDTTVTMADSGVTVKIYNVDKSTGKILSLSDFFKDGADFSSVLKDEVLRQMKINNAKDKNNTYFPIDSDPDMAALVDMDTEISNANFYVNKSGNLVLVFDKGTIAPMYMGVLEFEIPAEAIADISNSEYLNQ